MSYMAYYELNIDYIIETYCVNKEKPELQCNGKCHLANQLSNDSSDTSDKSSYLSSLFEMFVPVYFYKHNFDFNAFFKYKTIQNNWNYSKLFTSIFKDDFYRPPQV